MTWIRRFHPARAELGRVVLFPHAGGSAPFFFPFSHDLAEVAEVLCVQYPGRQDRIAEPFVTSVLESAEHILAELPATDLPTVLFGHSFGATLAYEVARRVRPRALIVSARRAPGDVRDRGMHRLDDDALLAELSKLDGMHPAILADPELVRLALPAVRADYQAAETYVHQPGPPLECPILALVGDTDPQVDATLMAHWGDYTTGRFDTLVFPGGHFYLTDHRATVVAEIIHQLGGRP